MTKRLFRSEESKIIAGVCGGIGEYFEIDPVLVRLITIILFFATGIGILAYVIAWIIIPKSQLEVPTGKSLPEKIPYAPWHKYLPGLILVGIGAILLIREHWFWFRWSELWPLVLIGVGIVLIFRSNHGREAIEKPANAQTDTQNGESIA